MENVSWVDLGVYLILYSVLGWAAEAGYYALAKRRFYNRGFLTLPLLLSYGVTFDLLILVLPPLGGNHILQFLVTLIVVSVAESLSNQLMKRFSPRLQWGEERTRLFSGSGKGLLSSAVIAGAYYFIYLVVHPLLMGAFLLVPALVKQIAVLVALALIAVDFTAVLYAVRTGDAAGYRRRQEKSRQSKMAARLSDAIWRRLHKAYPGIREMDGAEQGGYTFAKGLCFDKLIWVFLASALLGDIIETLYCRLVGGAWMSRSSVLYGPFSFVWGLGAVVLTVTLQRLAEKNDRYVFLAGFVVGGVYEYMCSVFTELVFGTVFWDYSHMPLNIGGRTNVLFCFFWGVLAVVWIKILYPPMSRAIEKLPAVAGKVLTWVVVLFMACNAVLTCGAMLRYNTRAVQPEPANAFEAFLDRRYTDAYMEDRWPNMIVAGPTATVPEEMT
ncbi:hypothetical protein CE91St41_13830 [Oscillospiraceae bacterium]|nr:hypothetical protein CE91St40_23710 [Oscillospiraceae bacterium]BDF74494.1 hypothetical protein CE91St41_13830 [Oscillospiraceae bacterium]